jgi:hypothetical protein
VRLHAGLRRLLLPWALQVPLTLRPLSLVLADLLGERGDVLLDLGLQRRRDHPASALPRQIIQRDPALDLLPHGEPANI